MHRSHRGTDAASARIHALLICLTLSVTATLAQAPDAPPLHRRLDAALSKVPDQTQVGLVVANATTGKTLYTHNADQPLKPASVQKLLVTAAALERFGPDFRFTTRAYLQNDELWIIGAGDPGLGDPRIAERDGRPVDHFIAACARALRQRGVSALHKIVLDDSIFDQQLRHPDWPDNQADRWYQAPVGGLNINDNCLDLTIHISGNRITWSSQPPVPPSLVQSRINKSNKQRPIVRRHPARHTIELAGTARVGGDLTPVAVKNPTIFFAHALKRGLADRHIRIAGDIVRRPLRSEEIDTATEVTQHTTPLPDILWRCNRYSQNLFAECLLKALAAYHRTGQPNGESGTWPSGAKVLRDTLTALGIDLDTAVIRDGSGLSHSNRLTARQITTLLVKMNNHPHREHLISSLAQPGESGSLQRRYYDATLRGRLRGKTGTIRGVRTLAGYVTGPGDTNLAFALLVNGTADRNLPRDIAKILATTSSNNN